MHNLLFSRRDKTGLRASVDPHNTRLQAGALSDLPLVTIVTPSFNQGALLRQCMATIEAQTYPRIQHIVVDGMSDDGTEGLLREWESPPMRRYIREPDAGMYDAINKGLRIADGDLVAYLNCDDLYFRYTISVLAAAITGSDADVVFGDMVRVYEDGRVWLKLLPPYRKSLYGYFYQFAQPSTMWRRSVSAELDGFDPAFRYAGDADFFLRAGRAGKRFYHVDEILSVERHMGTSLSAVHRQRLKLETKQSVSKHAQSLPFMERVVWSRFKVVCAIVQQFSIAFAFFQQYSSKARNRWPQFLANGYLRTFHPLALLVNVLPEPLSRRKLHIGNFAIDKVLSSTEPVG